MSPGATGRTASPRATLATARRNISRICASSASTSSKRSSLTRRARASPAYSSRSMASAASNAKSSSASSLRSKSSWTPSPTPTPFGGARAWRFSARDRRRHPPAPLRSPTRRASDARRAPRDAWARGARTRHRPSPCRSPRRHPSSRARDRRRVFPARAASPPRQPRRRAAPRRSRRGPRSPRRRAGRRARAGMDEWCVTTSVARVTTRAPARVREGGARAWGSVR